MFIWPFRASGTWQGTTGHFRYSSAVHCLLAIREVVMVSFCAEFDVLHNYTITYGLWIRHGGPPMINFRFVLVSGSRPRSSFPFAMPRWVFPSEEHRSCYHRQTFKNTCRAFISNSSRYTSTYTTTHALLISSSSGEDMRYLGFRRSRLTSNDGLPPLETCGIAYVFHRPNDSYVAHRQPKL
jgi:hypothetical protein